MSSKELPFENPVLLAPIAGYTDYPFRRLCRRHGAGMVYTELVSAEGLIRNGQKSAELMRIFPDEAPVGIQIFGSSPQSMEKAAQMAEELSPALIDINMGCCAQKVCSSGSGAALSRDIPLLSKIAESVVKAISLPVTAKIRLGWDSQSLNYMEMLQALEDGGIRAVTVHGRTRKQQYSGEADWDAIEEIASRASIPVIGNGDITSREQALSLLESTSCAAVMIGRGALGNPWIFSGSRPSPKEHIETVREHAAAMADYYGEYGIVLARKHAVKYFHHERSASVIRNRLVHASTLKEMNAILDLALELECGIRNSL